MVTLQLRITGRVQGVGYRYALRQEAQKLGVTGWVRNRRDGSVEALLHGDQSSVDAVVGWARRGPPGSGVEDIEISTVDGADQYAYPNFFIRTTE